MKWSSGEYKVYVNRRTNCGGQPQALHLQKGFNKTHFIRLLNGLKGHSFKALSLTTNTERALRQQSQYLWVRSDLPRPPRPEGAAP